MSGMLTASSMPTPNDQTSEDENSHTNIQPNMEMILAPTGVATFNIHATTIHA
jgi:hypothetical protein